MCQAGHGEVSVVKGWVGAFMAARPLGRKMGMIPHDRHMMNRHAGGHKGPLHPASSTPAPTDRLNLMCMGYDYEV